MKNSENTVMTPKRRLKRSLRVSLPAQVQRFVICTVAILVTSWSIWSIRADFRSRSSANQDDTASYRVEGVGYLGANAHDFNRVALNVHGHLAAGAPMQGRSHTVLDIGGQMTYMGSLPGFTSSQAYALNADDEIVGCSYRADGGYTYSLRPTRACVWKHNKIVALPTLPGYACSIARAISARGQVAGSCYTPKDEVFNATSHAVLWEQGHMHDLGVLPGFIQSSALAINDQGQVVGTLTKPDHNTHGFLWQKGHMQDLGVLTGCDTSMATSINSRGQVVGRSGKDPVHMVMWESNKIRDLGTVPGAPSLYPIRVNAAGRVLVNAGTGSLRVGDYPRPYLWDSIHGFVPLRTLIGRRSGYFLWRGLDLNDQGQIAAGGRYRASAMQVFLLTPQEKAKQ